MLRAGLQVWHYNCVTSGELTWLLWVHLFILKWDRNVWFLGIRWDSECIVLCLVYRESPTSSIYYFMISQWLYTQSTSSWVTLTPGFFSFSKELLLYFVFANASYPSLWLKVVRQCLYLGGTGDRACWWVRYGWDVKERVPFKRTLNVPD